MLRAAFLVLVFVGVLLAGLILQLPVAFIVEQSGVARQGVSWTRVSGTLWQGQVRDLNIAGQPLGNVRFQLKPLALLDLRMSYAVDISGAAVNGKGELSAGLDGTLQAANVLIDVNVQRLARLDSRLRQAPSELSLTLRAAEIGADFSCLAADGGLQTNILSAVGERWSWNGPGLQGQVNCASAAFLIDMQGASATDQIRARGKFDLSSGLYDLTAEVQTSDPNVEMGLRALTFTDRSGVYTYRRTNAEELPTGTEP